MIRSTVDEFIEKARKKHGDKYDYTGVNYVNTATKVRIICPIHGEFWQTPHSHLSGRGCPQCGKDRKISKMSLSDKIFIERARGMHGDKYDYSRVSYKNARTKVCIICPVHGEFWQSPNHHLRGCGCPKCGGTGLLSKNDFVRKAIKAHGDVYDYSRVEYVNNCTKVCIICPTHGEFWQTPGNHLQGQGCPICGGNQKQTKESFAEKASRVHCGKYDYSKVTYVNCDTKVCIICPKHGEFWQSPYTHLNGCGCPKCRMSHLERATMSILGVKNVKFEMQKKFAWLKTDKGKMSLDFFIPRYNTAIECQGIQHYRKGGMFTGKIVDKIKKRDRIKRKLCSEHGISIFYIKYDDDVNEKINNFLSVLLTRKANEI